MSTSQSSNKDLLPGKEYPRNDEAKVAMEIVEMLKNQMIRMYSSKGAKQHRQIHPKLNGCVKAEFIIEPNLEPELRVGLFKEAKSYPAWIRFSNGETKPVPDTKKDNRGFALKLMNVPGEKMDGTGSFDFILMNPKKFVAGSVNKFKDILFVATTPWPLSSIPRKIFYIFSNLPILSSAIKSKIKINHPCEIPYFSSVPYRFGDETRAVKYAVIPSGKNQLECPDKTGANFLRANLAETLKKHEIIYDFFVQFQDDPVKMPIENPAVEWTSAFTKVATIRIPVQEFDTYERNELGDNLAFNIWHCLPEHRPLGNFSRARRIIYEHLQEFRHQQNKLNYTEPKAGPDFFKELNSGNTDTSSNLQIVQQMYKNFADGNLPAVLALFDKDIVWKRNGDPDIPFSGTFKGIQESIRMLTITHETIKVLEFVPEKFVDKEDMVFVIGHDRAEVIATGKVYKCEWVQVFTLKDKKITQAIVYLDSLAIAKAFQA